MSNISIIIEIQRDIVNNTESISSILRKVYLVAIKLNLADTTEWARRELYGYREFTLGEFPKYRQIPAIPRARNPYNGWIPVYIDDETLREVAHRAYLHQSIDELVELAKSTDGLSYSYPKLIQDKLRTDDGLDLEVRGLIASQSIHSCIASIKNRILEWALELESSGILGEDLVFSDIEKQQATHVTQIINATHIGSVETANDGSTIRTRDRTVIFKISDIPNELIKIKTAIPGLPADVQSDARSASDEASEAASSGDGEKLRSAFQSLRFICEGAAGNIAATGILNLLSTLKF